ncbi:hypothetical protein N7G274_010097 [Stereocaulon virgatum]|uniref:Uncharacterized protein n=1 Tax=Stereocaulon virgatum TaxID=373712 RepID=A0ABR3ZXI8_9LECA
MFYRIRRICITDIANPVESALNAKPQTQELAYEVEYIRDGQNRHVPDDVLGLGHFKMKRTARSAAFVERALNYNNLLSFTSEGVDKMDHRVGRTTCKIQGGCITLSVHFCRRFEY